MGPACAVRGDVEVRLVDFLGEGDDVEEGLFTGSGVADVHRLDAEICHAVEQLDLLGGGGAAHRWALQSVP